MDNIPGVPGSQYLRARYYDPNIGRFISQDTVFGEMNSPLTQNLYIYCLNNGVNYSDPSGNSVEEDLYIQLNNARGALGVTGNSQQKAAIQDVINSCNKKLNDIKASKASTANKNVEKAKKANAGTSVITELEKIEKEAVEQSTSPEPKSEIHQYKYADDKGNEYAKDWEISNEMFKKHKSVYIQLKC